MRVRNVAGAAIVAGAAAIIVTGPGVFAAGGSPANKVAAAGSKTAVVTPGTNETLLTATMKTSKPTDLILQVTLECSLFTALTTNDANPLAEAHSSVRVWVEMDGKIVPIQSVSSPPQDPSDQPAGNDTDKVTFCDRTYHREVTDMETDHDGMDQISDYIRTKSSHAFNWIRMNSGSAMHTIAVKADIVTESTDSARAEAMVGNRTLVVEPTKMANSAVISDNGSSTSGGARALRRSRRH